MINSMSSLVSVLTPLFAVPMTVIIFFLKSMKEDQREWQDRWMLRLDAIEQQIGQCKAHLERMERKYVTREEWLQWVQDRFAHDPQARGMTDPTFPTARIRK
ncbi:MAG: hypothetical protein ACYTHJ_10730 [Planctomycetota bacterium]|jgi:hypothetical protein